MDILSIGDSTARGYVGTTLSPWGGSRGRIINLLRQQYDARPVGPTVQTEYPFWGPFWATATIASARADIASVLATDSPDLVLIGLGTNDILNMTVSELPPVAILENLAALAGDIHAEIPGVPIWVGQVPPMTVTTDVANMAGLFNAYLPSYMQPAREAGANVYTVASMKGVTSSHLADGVHPTEDGYILIADNWYRALTTPVRAL